MNIINRWLSRIRADREFDRHLGKTLAEGVYREARLNYLEQVARIELTRAQTNLARKEAGMAPLSWPKEPEPCPDKSSLKP